MIEVGGVPKFGFICKLISVKAFSESCLKLFIRKRSRWFSVWIPIKSNSLRAYWCIFVMIWISFLTKNIMKENNLIFPMLVLAMLLSACSNKETIKNIQLNEDISYTIATSVFNHSTGDIPLWYVSPFSTEQVVSDIPLDRTLIEGQLTWTQAALLKKDLNTTSTSF